MSDAPEVEVFCGGVNTKTSSAVAVWRQGNLLHFGFDASPAELNSAGKALLINSIAYITRFRADRPILEAEPPSAKHPILTRATMVRIIARNSSEEWDYLKANFDPTVLTTAGIKQLPAFARWYPSVRDFLVPSADGLMTVDTDAQALYLKPGRPEFFPRAIALLARPECRRHPRPPLAGTLLRRPIAPDRPRLPKSGPPGGRPTATISSSPRTVAIAGTSTPWPRIAKCPPPSSAARSGQLLKLDSQFFRSRKMYLHHII